MTASSVGAAAFGPVFRENACQPRIFAGSVLNMGVNPAGSPAEDAVTRRANVPPMDLASNPPSKGSFRAEIMEVEIILEPGIQHPDFSNGLQFFRHDGFARIGPEFGCRHIEHYGKRNFFGGNGQRVPESDIHLQGHHRLAELARSFTRMPAYPSCARMSSHMMERGSKSTPSASTSKRHNSLKMSVNRSLTDGRS